MHPPSAEPGGRAAKADGRTDGAKQSFNQLLEDLFSADGGLEELQKESPEELRTFFCQHHCHRGFRERRILAIGGAIPAKGDRAVIEAKSAVVKVIVQLIRSLLQGIAELDRKIEEAAAE